MIMLVIIVVNYVMMRNTIQYVRIKPLQIISVQLKLTYCNIIIIIMTFFHCVDNTKV